jgi:hypothetical protein
MSAQRELAMADPSSRKHAGLEWETLLHPAQAFAHPSDVVDDPVLTFDEKRAILASWASDACAVDAAPGLRRPPGTRQPVSVDEILEALRTLDLLAGERCASWARRQVRRASIQAFRASRSTRKADGGRGLRLPG